MPKAFKSLIILAIVLSCALSKTSAQQNITTENKSKLDKLQDTLAVLSEATFSAKDNLARFEKNTQFVKKLISALKITDAYNYGFDSLKRISILPSPDRSFRMITWYVPTDEGTFRYYGTIQMATNDGSLKMYPLTDQTEKISDQNELTNAKMWFGARYYDIIPMVSSTKQPYWILLGWKGNNQKTTKKVIEVLSFDKDEPLFGKNIFETDKKGIYKNRIIFEYNKLNAMTLKFERKLNLIVFDHLAPYEPSMLNNYEYYVADLTFNAYKLNSDKLALVENVDLKNEPSPNDEFYGKPVKASTVVIKPNH